MLCETDIAFVGEFLQGYNAIGRIVCLLEATVDVIFGDKKS